jgi:hypothetical protein
MVESIAAALERIKDDPHACIGLPVIENVCVELGLQWRDTQLTPPVTIALLAQQVLAGNVSNPELIRRAGLKVTAGAYCTAKGRLPLEAVEQISRRVCAAAARAGDGAEDYRWRGHRTWHVDGSSFSMPDTPELQKRFGQSGRQKPGCGFPVAHLLCLFDASSGLVRDVVVSPLRTHDLAPTPRLHPHLGLGDILIGDTAFGSFFHLAALQKQGAFGVFPNHQARIVNFRPGRKHAPRGKKRRPGQPSSRWVKKLGKDDQLVEYFRPIQCPSWMNREEYAASPRSIIVREIRRTIYRRGFRPMTIVIVTTLLDPAIYPADEIVALLGERWDVETNLRHLKTTMRLELLRCQSVAGVLKELWTFMLIYNLVRLIMMEAAERQKVPPNRISFADTLYWMRYARPGDGLPNLIVNPDRPDRAEPRAIKRRPKKYALITKPRDEMRKALKSRG